MVLSVWGYHIYVAMLGLFALITPRNFISDIHKKEPRTKRSPLCLMKKI